MALRVWVCSRADGSLAQALGRRVDGSDGVRIALQEGLGGGSFGGGGDACFRCGQRGHAARECTQPQEMRRTLVSAADAWQQSLVDAPLIKALLTAALYPQAREGFGFLCVCVCDTLPPVRQVMTVTYPAKKGGKPLKPESLKFHIREDSNQVVEVAVHPSSVNSKEVQFDSQYLVYHEKARSALHWRVVACSSGGLTQRASQVRTTRIYVRDCSTVSPYALMLFGGALSSERAGGGGGGGGRRGAPPPDALLVVDNWIKFSVPRHAVDLLLQVRAEMDAVLRRKIENPNADISAAGRHLLDAVVSMLGSEGGGAAAR